MEATAIKKNSKSLKKTPIGAALRELRVRNSVSLDEASTEAGVDISWLSRAERGFRQMPEEKAQAIREAIIRIVEQRGVVR